MNHFISNLYLTRLSLEIIDLFFKGDLHNVSSIRGSQCCCAARSGGALWCCSCCCCCCCCWTSPPRTPCCQGYGSCCALPSWRALLVESSLCGSACWCLLGCLESASPQRRSSASQRSGSEHGRKLFILCILGKLKGILGHLTFLPWVMIKATHHLLYPSSQYCNRQLVSIR